jgi:hypothetical protein
VCTTAALLIKSSRAAEIHDDAGEHLISASGEAGQADQVVGLVCVERSSDVLSHERNSRGGQVRVSGDADARHR